MYLHYLTGCSQSVQFVTNQNSPGAKEWIKGRMKRKTDINTALQGQHIFKGQPINLQFGSPIHKANGIFPLHCGLLQKI